MKQDSDLPRVLVGPLLRHVQAERILLWLVTTRQLSGAIVGKLLLTILQERDLIASEQTELVIGENAYLQLLELKADSQ